jgi:medium-chain acyl-[acyl-carrier-protein] hydrolase
MIARRTRLYCFPYAGGSAAIFRGWNVALGESIEVVPLEYPGRGRRIRERPCDSLPSLLSELTSEILLRPPAPTAFFGYSLGALVAYEMARLLDVRIGASLTHLLVAAFGAPHMRPPATGPEAQADLATRLRVLGGTPEELLADESLLAVLAPAIEADFGIVDRYVYEPAPLLTCPITVLGGSDDSNVSARRLRGWRSLTTERCEVHLLPGGHFFLHEQTSSILRLVAKALQPSGTELLTQEGA